MSQKPGENVRARDDRHLRQLATETRQWMQAEGIEEQELDWQAIAREEQTLWWKERLRQALRELAAPAGALTETIAAWLKRLTAGPDVQQSLVQRLQAWLEQAEHSAVSAEAAVHALLTPGHAGTVYVQAALSHPSVQFAYADTGLRGERSEAAGIEQAASAVIVRTDALPGARVAIEGDAIVVTFLDWQSPSPPLVVLVPEDDQGTPRMPDATEGVGGVWTVCFEHVPSGTSLLAVAPTSL